MILGVNISVQQWMKIPDGLAVVWQPNIYFFGRYPSSICEVAAPAFHHGSGNPDKMNGRYLCSLPFSCIFQAWGNFCAAIFFKISQMRSLRRPCFLAPVVSDRIKDLGNVITSCDTNTLHCVNKSSCEGGGLRN